MTRSMLLGIAVSCSVLATSLAGCGPDEKASGESTQAVRGGAGKKCGDGVCGRNETSSTCPADCPAVCGDGGCNGDETCSSCPADCGVCPAACGDGACNGTETCSSCSADCGTCTSGCANLNGTCDAGEDCITCPDDCGTCPIIGAGSCQTNDDCMPSACCLDQSYLCVSSEWAPTGCGGACNQDCPERAVCEGYCACYTDLCTAIFPSW